MNLPYDRTSDGYTLTTDVKPGDILFDGTVSTFSGHQDSRMRPLEEMERCGPYTYKGKEEWGDHRVTIPGTTCVEVDCHVAHHPDIFPGEAEHREDYYKRPGVNAIAASLWGWDAAGRLPRKMGDTSAWAAAHVALDALRDAGYELVEAQAEDKKTESGEENG